MFTMRRQMTVKEARAASGILLAFVWNDVLWLTWLGLSVITGGAQRMSGPGYAKLRGLADSFGIDPGVFWGVPLLIAAVLLVSGMFLDSQLGAILRVCAFLIGGMCAGSLVALFAAVAAEDPAVGNTAPPSYLFIAVYQLNMIAGTLFLQGIRPTSQSKE